MNKVWYGLLVGILLVSLAGCVTVEKVVRERVDQEISGNQGYIQGGEPLYRETEARPREYIDVKVELPTWEEVKKDMSRGKGKSRKPTEDREVAGNRGYLSGSRGFEKGPAPVYKPRPVVLRPAEPAGYEYEEEEAIVYPEEVEVIKGEAVVAPQTYKVQKGETLSHIAKRFYGKAHKWTLIYEANSDKIKDPNKVKAGTVLVIPELEEVKSGYAK